MRGFAVIDPEKDIGKLDALATQGIVGIRLNLIGKTRQVWVKLSAPYRSSDAVAAQAAPLLRQAFGPDRLMWGSDWPNTGFEGKVKYTALRSQLDGWVPDPAERRIVLVESPASLFRF